MININLFTAALPQNTDLPPNNPVPTTLLSNSREKGTDRPRRKEVAF